MVRVRVVARFGGPGSATSRIMAWSLLTHMVFVVVLVLLPSLRSRRTIPDSALIVDLVPLAAPAARAASAPAPVETSPEPSAPPDGVRMETSVPEPAPEKAPPPKEPDPKPERKPEKKLQATVQRPAPPGPETAGPAPGEASNGPPGEAGATIEALEGAGDFELGWYKGSVTAALYGQWRKPILEGIIEPREVRVSFEIQRDGRVTALRVERTSGVPSLDRSALRAVRDASPLPPLPANWRENKLAASFVFRLYPE